MTLQYGTTNAECTLVSFIMLKYAWLFMHPYTINGMWNKFNEIKMKYQKPWLITTSYLAGPQDQGSAEELS